MDIREVDSKLEGWTRGWLLGWRKVCRSVDARTFIPTVLPRVPIANSAITGLPENGRSSSLVANLSSFVLDYCARQKLGGTNMA